MVETLKRTAAYVPWATFKNSIDQLAKGIPSRIDRSVFAGTAWNAQTQLFIALKFFGFLKGDDEPTALLEDVVKGTEEERKAKLSKAIRDAYADLIAIDLTKATRSHFEEKLGELYNASGDTRVKAVRFFLSAASYANIPLSSFILPKNGKAKGTRKPRTTAPKKAFKKGVASSTNPSNPPAGQEQNKPVGESRSVSLASGGMLTLSATANFLSLSSADRKFVFDLIDKLEAYAEASK